MSVTITEAVRSKTASRHDEILKKTSFMGALRAGTLPDESCVGYLRALTAVYTVLARQPDPPPGVRDALDLLQKDLVSLRYRLISDLTPAAEAALGFVANLRLRLKDRPASARGYAWALMSVTRAMTPPPEGFLSFTAGGPPEIEDEGLSSEDTDAVVSAAAGAYDFLYELLTLLHPFDGDRTGFTSFTLNPAGGAYPACQSREALTAVLHASDYALAVCPYYLYRYGCSGILFSDSDGAWLTTLTELGFPAMEEQVLWLAKVLSARGMPTFLMARHLRFLGDELGRTCPEGADRWKLMYRAAGLLDLDAPALRVMGGISELLRAAGSGEGFAAEEAAGLIVGALLDERRGFPGSVEDVVAWYSDGRVTAAGVLAEKAREFLDREYRRENKDV